MSITHDIIADPTTGRFDSRNPLGRFIPVPAKIEELTFVSSTTTSITFSWAADANADTYNVYVDSESTPRMTGVTGTEATLGGLSSDSSFNIRVSGVNTAGEGPKSDPVTMTTEAFVEPEPGETVMSSSVEQYGITWYFDQEYEVGQYANGDWFVVGPVTITNITPESVERVADTSSGTRIVNGTDVDPISGVHGYDNYSNGEWGTPGGFSEERNVAPSFTGQPLSITKGSVVSSISLSDAEATSSNGRPALRDVAVLTVVSVVPPADSFRPAPYANIDKDMVYNISQLDYSILKSLSPPPNVDTISTCVNLINRLWVDHTNDTNNGSYRFVKATNNGQAYGAAQARENVRVLLRLHLNDTIAEKEPLMIAAVQRGIDTYGAIVGIDKYWGPDGGQSHGNKAFVVLAALALNDAGMKAVADGHGGTGSWDEDYRTSLHWWRWSDDTQLDYVIQEDIDRGNNVSHKDGCYPQESLGAPEWSTRMRWNRYGTGGGHSGMPGWAEPNATGARGEPPCNTWDHWTTNSYRWSSNARCGIALAMRLTDGAVDVWNYPAYFDYTDRYVNFTAAAEGTPPGQWSSYGIRTWCSEMWTLYRSLGGPEWKWTEGDY